MHYRHSFHAGNFADVFKHVVLCGLLQSLNRKDTPWSYLDTHAGAGRYELGAGDAERTGEWRDGIGRLWALDSAPEPLAEYLRVVRAANTGAEVNAYPGSPVIAAALARTQDRLVLCERVPAVATALKEEMSRDRRVKFHQRDGYEAAALLPPKEKRGLVLVDPPFERPDEFEASADFLEAALKRFAHGQFAVWYALKNSHAAGRFLRRCARLGGKPPLDLQFDNGARAQGQMRACGMLLINPPHLIEQSLAPALHVVREKLDQGHGATLRIAPLHP